LILSRVTLQSVRVTGRIEPIPNIDSKKARRCAEIQAIAMPLDKRYLATFLVDWSWGSSVLCAGAEP
jgi:hypothetical protein